MTHHTNLIGRIDGFLNYGQPIPATFRLGEQQINPEILLKIGQLLESIRLNDRANIIKAQINYLHALGANPDLIATLTKTKLKVDITIRNGAGNVQICEDIMRFIREMCINENQVSTYGEEEVISAGGYIWMTGRRRFTRRRTRYLWHTRTPHPEGATQADKEEDLQIFRPFFEGAKEPMRSKYLRAIDEDDKNCHEITTTGDALIRAGLAEQFE